MVHKRSGVGHLKICSSHAKTQQQPCIYVGLAGWGVLSSSSWMPSPVCETSRLRRLYYCVYDAGPNGERYCWYQATVKGGREGRPIDAVKLARVCQDLGAGEIMLNCVDMDGQVREAAAGRRGEKGEVVRAGWRGTRVAE